MDDAAPLGPARTADPLERAMAHVEDHAFEPLALADLAAVAGLSPYHFARQFSARYGLTPMAFVRARRLGLAARLLASPRPPALIELAFDTGFESQEAFTRAFKRAFGVSPGRYRKRRAAPTPTEVLAMSDVVSAVRLTQEPSPVRKPALRVAGPRAVFGEDNKAGIPLLWPRLIERLPLAGQLGEVTYGVGWAASGVEGCFNCMAAVAIAADAPAPEGLETKLIPEQSYLVFRLETDASDLHTQMQAAHRQIWGERAPNSGFKLADAPDLEVYPPGFQPDRPSRIEWWIPVEI
ncbi:MAG TPA: helix-turn-helix domain-containing protein [Caulobacteraceae bacterium]|jgi:AraC family transcriptional regulator